jgi:hypothetical protein
MLYAQQQRLILLDRIKNIFVNLDKKDYGMPENKMISFIKTEFGVTEKKAKEYIKDLLDINFIRKDDLGLWLNKKINTAEETEINNILDGTKNI